MATTVPARPQDAAEPAVQQPSPGAGRARLDVSTGTLARIAGFVLLMCGAQATRGTVSLLMLGAAIAIDIELNVTLVRWFRKG